MNVFYNTNEAFGKISRSVITTGSFDGVHIGHKIIIQRLNEIARDIDGQSTLVTFHPHPRKVLYPEQTDLKLINSQEEKIQLLSKTGLHNLVILPFSVDFSKTTSHDFITRILISQLDARIIVVGNNHHFGHNRSGDFGYLFTLSTQLGFQVEDIPLKDIENETVSSTKIRKALLEGNIMRANAYLDHQYIIIGVPEKIHDEKNPSGLVFRMLLPEKEKLVPPPGIYATCIGSGKNMCKSMTIIQQPTNGGGELIDTHILCNPKELFSKQATLYFYKKIKGKEIFADQSNLYAQIQEAQEEIDELIY